MDEMTGLLAALLLFTAIVGLVAAYRTDDDGVRAFADSPRRLPDPGPRDLHTVTSGTLGRAHVPNWG